MSEFFWPDDPDLGTRARKAWPAVVEGLPVGTRVTGTVIGRQPFGVFISIDQVPDAIGLVRVIALSRGADLPLRGERITGDVLWHNESSFQVTVVPVGRTQDMARPRLDDEFPAMKRKSQGEGG